MEPLIFLHSNVLNHYGINTTIVFSTWLVVFLLAILSFLATRNLQVYPGRLQNVMEVIIDGLHALLIDTMGEHGKKFFPLIATLGLFILTANLIGIIPGFESPTANINTNLAMALVVFFSTHVVGVITHGFKYIKQFLGPVWWLIPLMLPIELISHLSRPLLPRPFVSSAISPVKTLFCWSCCCWFRCWFRCPLCF